LRGGFLWFEFFYSCFESVAWAELIPRDELEEQVKQNLRLQFLIGLEMFQSYAPFDSSLIIFFARCSLLEQKRLAEAVVNQSNESIITCGLAGIQSTALQCRQIALAPQLISATHLIDPLPIGLEM
jgi:hypothetical protein